MKLRCGKFYFFVFGVKNLTIYSVTRVWVSVCAQVCIGVLLALSVHLFVWSRVSPECRLSFSWLCCKSARGSNLLFSPPLKACLTGVCHMSSCYTAMDQHSAPKTYDVSTLPHWAISQLLVYCARPSRVQFVCKQHSAPMIIDTVSAFLAIYSSS